MRACRMSDKAGTVALYRKVVGRDRWRHAGHNISQQLPGAAGHRPAQRTVAGIEEQVFKGLATDYRRAVLRHRPHYGP